MKLTAFERVRPETNLSPDEKYTLPKRRLKTGFLGVFTKAYAGDARKTLVKLALGAIADTKAIPMGKPPAAARGTDEAALQRDQKKQLKLWEETRAEEQLYKLTELRKRNGTDPHFVISLPILKIGVGGLGHVFSLFGAAGAAGESAAEELQTFLKNDAEQLFPAVTAIANSGIGPDAAALFKGCLLGVRYKSLRGNVLISLEMRISEEEAEHLVSEDWVNIRPVDLYPLLSMWAAVEYEDKFYGKTAISVSKIAATLPPHAAEDVRVDDYGVGIGMDGEPIFLPVECDNTAVYESQFAGVGGNPDGSFSLGSLDPQEHLRKVRSLPINKPILCDWVNFKFSYTNTEGKIAILPLEHVRKCTASMARNLLRRTFPITWVGGFAKYAQRAGSPTNISEYLNAADLDETTQGNYDWLNPTLTAALKSNRSVDETCVMLEAQFKQREGASRPNLLEFANDGDPAFRWVYRFLYRVYHDMKENLDSVYAAYAVSTITNQLGWLALIAKYNASTAQTLMQADSETLAAANQGIDKNWKQPDLPLITKKFENETGGMLPHQARVRNMLKDSPAFAVLSVHAGGGKSMLAITDVLTEIKAHRSAPYLIMCPSHLIANYVSELVEFTDGMVNVIPITSNNIRTTGYQRYDAILDSAPINTVILVDYDALKFRAKATVYGTTSVPVYPVVEMLRKFKPGYALLDECHLLKNTRSTRFKTLMSLIADIPKKRIASGTLNPDSPSDLAGQLAIMDPTVFGSRERFNDMFAAEMRGSKVIKWKPQAGAIALQMLKGSMVWAEAKRREWACALPPRTDRFIPVELTERQREVYDALFSDMVQSIRRDAEGKGGKKAKKLLESLEGKKASKADNDDFENLGEDGESGGPEDILDDSGDVGAGLQPYLAALEMFVSDPASHPYAVNGWVNENGERQAPLSGDDLKSPKALMLEHQLKTWVSTKKSKAIVFTNYTNTAEALYNAMPPELQAQGLLYKASEKIELINRFTKDPNIKWLIGIRKSMEVGLNLQAAGYLIRMEGVWNPGEQEQGDSRICRPYFGPGGDQRDEIVFDTIVADKTIDITKAARLRAKMVALAKFENPNDPAYQDIEDLPLLTMNLDTIVNRNNFNENLAQYADSMRHLNQVMKDDYAAYAEKIKAEGGFKFTQISRSETPAECKLMARVPYAHGTQLYAAADLGLVRVDNYLGQEMSAEEEEEGDTEGADEELEEIDEDVAANQALVEQKEILIGKRCHTELGEGYIANVGFKKGKLTRVLVNLDDGTTYRQHVTNVFVATREETNSIDMRNAIAKAAGLDITAPITVPALTVKQTKVTQKMLREQEKARKEKLRQERLAEKKAKGNKQLSVALHLSIINGYLRLGYTPTDANATKAMEAVGFKLDQPYVYTLVRSARHLLKQAQLWLDAGFNTAKDVDNDALALLHEELSSGALRSHKHYVKTVADGGFQNYIRKTWKPNPDKKLLTMFALITDGGHQEQILINRAEKEGQDTPYGAAYLCMPLGGGFPGTLNAIKPQYKAPGTTWRRSEDELSIFVSGFTAVRRVLVALKEAGIMVTNIDELNRQARSVKRAQNIIKTEGLDLTTDEDWTDSPEKAGKAGKPKANKAEQAEKLRKSKQTGR